MILGQEHVPETALASFGFEVLENGGGGCPSLFAFSELGLEEGVCGDAVFFDEFFDLERLEEVVVVGETYQVEGLLGLVADKGKSDRGDFGGGSHDDD